MANFKYNSRYTTSSIASNRSNQNYVTNRQALDLPEDSTDTFITVTQEYQKRPDLLSYKLYGITDYWWAVYEFNNIRDPLFGVKPGDILRVPTLDRLLAHIESK